MEGDGLEALLAELESEVACSQALGESPPGGHAALGAGLGGRWAAGWAESTSAQRRWT